MFILKGPKGLKIHKNYQQKFFNQNTIKFRIQKMDFTTD